MIGTLVDGTSYLNFTFDLAQILIIQHFASAKQCTYGIVGLEVCGVVSSILSTQPKEFIRAPV